jgi:hypothetical protein
MAPYTGLWTRNSPEDTSDAQILINSRPVDVFAVANKLEEFTVLLHGIMQARVPGERNPNVATIGQAHDYLVAREANSGRSRVINA